MPRLDSPSYSLSPSGGVVIHDGILDIKLDRESLVAAIANIRRTRDDFATADAYTRRLALYEGALEFLDAEGFHS